MNRKIWFLSSAFAAVALGTAAALPVVAAPETAGAGGVPDSAVLSVVTALGDDLFSTVDLTSAIDPTGMSTQHYGPYASGSTDSGTCGNDWANDTFDRHFTVHFNPGSAITVIEQFKDGNFVTPASDSPPVNFSPGGCQNSATPQGKVNDGVTGTLHGYLIIPLPPGTMQTQTDPHCNATLMTDANCDTTTFIDTHFTPCYGTGVCSAGTFFFHYTAPSQGLLENEWKNASADRGGNSGDIRSANI